jgi:hypothetical protein
VTDEPTIADELNNQQLWHKVAGALCAKLGGDVRITGEDFVKALTGNSVVVSHEDGGKVLRIRMLPAAEAERLRLDFQRAAKRKH